MIKKVIVFFIAFLFLITSYRDKKNIVNNSISNEIENSVEKKNIDVSLMIDDKVNKIDLEEYVIGVVSCEMPASFNYEALKAMSVAARTFALYKIKTNKDYVLSPTTKDQCYISVDKMKKNWKDNFESNYNKIKNAVMDTKNEFMTYNDEIIISFYFSISNGYTENCEDVFSQKLDYLKSVDSAWDKEYSFKEKTVKFSEKDFLKKLNINEEKVNNIKIERNKTNRADYIYVNNHKIKGTKFRNLLGLRSTDVDININNGNISIKTKGYGHGVGMSQYGANYMANNGYKYDEILKYYYSGVKINE